MIKAFSLGISNMYYFILFLLLLKYMGMVLLHGPGLPNKCNDDNGDELPELEPIKKRHFLSDMVILNAIFWQNMIYGYAAFSTDFLRSYFSVCLEI